ncbi:thioesterase [Burkholderia pseudomallei]|uniref:thioesterase n=1 Tax=Burkholderia pseudomallei TaxID=28450 RepID=UPI0009B2057C|nr:thioesterase [Burkholderia pseudomallei]
MSGRPGRPSLRRATRSGHAARSTPRLRGANGSARPARLDLHGPGGAAGLLGPAPLHTFSYNFRTLHCLRSRFMPLHAA